MAIEIGERIAQVETEIRLHKDECGRRYEESDRKFDRMFQFVKDAHRETNEKVDGLMTKINSINLSDAVQAGEIKGSLRVKNVIGHTISVLIGGGVLGIIVNLLHK